MKVIVTGGGTGGHIYPALAVINSLGSLNKTVNGATAIEPEAKLSTDPAITVWYLGHESGMESLIVPRAGLSFHGISSGPLRGQQPLETIGNIARIGKGLSESLGLMRQLKPDVILATGGYVCVPVVMAGWLSKVPSLIYLPDVTPGMAVSFLARFARRVAVSIDDAARFFPAGKTVVTGYPVRPELQVVSRAAARTKLGLPATDRVLLVLGGSRGARSINDAVARSLGPLLKKAFVLHICGSGKDNHDRLQSLRAELPEQIRDRYRLYPYLHEDMGCALAAADLVVSRAGASVMGEFPAFALPSILVPYPFAGAHQELNARCLVDQGAAVRVGDDELPQGRLLEIVQQLFDNTEKLDDMRHQAQAMARPNAAREIGDLLWSLAKDRDR